MLSNRYTKRGFIAGLGGCSVAALLPSATASAGTLALRQLELDKVSVIDSHVHPVIRAVYSAGLGRLGADMAGAEIPPGDYPGKAALQERAIAANQKLLWDAPRRIGYLNYISDRYNVPPTLDGFDSVVQPNIGSDAAFTAYVRKIFDRERVAGVILQAAEPSPTPPATLVPSDRYVWTSVASDYTRLAWAKERSLTRIDDVVAAIDQTMERAVDGGCRGFKIAAAYYRPLAMKDVDRATAQQAFALVRNAVPDRYGPRQQPIFDDPALAAAQTTYEDYLFKHVYKTCGRVGRPAIIHSAVALHPLLRADWNDPRPLYAIFTNPEILKAGTSFVIIHGGFPAHELIAGYVSQFPNVYVDVSFYTKYPLAALELYRGLLTIAPSEKVMHGSDANTVPEEIGYCAFNTRAALATVLLELRDQFDWTPVQVARVAENILHANAARLFDFPAK